MNIRSNITQFKRLDKAIVDGEAGVEQAKWDQAMLAFEACTGESAIIQRDYAASVGKSLQHISVLVRMWRRVEEKVHERGDLPNFAATYQHTNLAGKTRTQQYERQVPSQKQDRVDMAATLVVDDEVLDEILDDPVVKARLKKKVDEDEARRAARRAKAARQAREDPAGKVVRDAIAKMDLYARALDMLAEEWVYALEDVPPELKAKLAKAAGRLEAAAHRFAEATKGRRSLHAVR